MANVSNTRPGQRLKNYTPGVSPNLTYADVLLNPQNGASKQQSKLGEFFGNAKNVGADILSNVDFTAKNFFNPNAGGKISYGLGTGKTGGLGKAGLNIGGMNLGKFATIGAGVGQGLDAIGGLSEMSDLNQDSEDLINAILISASGNPLASSFLTSDDLSLLAKIKRGNYDAESDLGDAVGNLGGILGGAASGALSGIAGGLPGIAVGAIGGAANSGIDNMNSATSREIARLEALYQNLLNAEQQYKAMRRPNFNGLGIQQQYQNMYM